MTGALGRVAARLSPPIRQALLFAAAIAWVKALGFLTIPLLTGQLAPADFARLELLASAAELGALLAGAGLVDTAYRFAGTDDAAGRRAMAHAMGLAVVIALALAGVVGALSPVIAGAMPLATTSVEVTLLGIAVATEALIGVPLAWMRMRGRAGLYAAATILRGSIQVALMAVLVLGGWGVGGVLAAGAITAVGVVLVLLAGQARATGVALAPSAWGGLLAYGVPLVGGGLASFMLGTADRWFLADAVAPEALARYALAGKVALIAALLTQPFELWWYPRRIALLAHAEGREQAARVALLGVWMTLLAAAVTAIAGPVLIRLMTPPVYHAAASFVPWLALAIALQSIGSLLNAGSYAGRTGLPSMTINGVAAAVAAVLYLVLIPSLGVWGAIVATLLAQATRGGLFVWDAQRRVWLPYRVGPALAPVLLTLLAIPAPAWIGVPALVAAVGAAMAAGLLPRPGLGTWPRGAARA